MVDLQRTRVRKRHPLRRGRQGRGGRRRERRSVRSACTRLPGLSELVVDRRARPDPGSADRRHARAGRQDRRRGVGASAGTAWRAAACRVAELAIDPQPSATTGPPARPLARRPGAGATTGDGIERDTDEPGHPVHIMVRPTSRRPRQPSAHEMPDNAAGLDRSSPGRRSASTTRSRTPPWSARATRRGVGRRGLRRRQP